MTLIGPPNYSSELRSTAFDKLVPHSLGLAWPIALFADSTLVAWTVSIKAVDLASQLTITHLHSFTAMECQPTVLGSSLALLAEILRYTRQEETLVLEARHLQAKTFLTLWRFLKAIQVLHQQPLIRHLSHRPIAQQKRISQRLKRPAKTPAILWKILASLKKKQVRNENIS